MDLLKMRVPEFTTLDVSIDPVVDPAPTLTVPTEIVSAPVKVFVPDNVSVPVPILVRPINEPEITPDIVPVVELATCTVELVDIATEPDSVPAPLKLTTPTAGVPAPAPEIVSGSLEVTPPTSRVAPSDTVVPWPALEPPSAFAWAILTVPTEIDVVPVYVLAADSSSVPAPVLVRPAAAGVVTPEMTPDIVPVVKLAT